MLTVLWGCFYLLDAILYWLALAVHDGENRGRFVYWTAELGNVIASAAYVASQALYYHPDFATNEQAQNTLERFARISVIQAAAYCGSLFLWSVNSFQYVVVWRADLQQDQRPKRFFLCDLGFWAEFFNVWPSIGYFATSLWGLIVLFPVLNSGVDLAGFIEFYQRNQVLQLVINLAWDIGFSIDASSFVLLFLFVFFFLFVFDQKKKVLYVLIWLRDGRYYSSSKYVELTDDGKKESFLPKGTYY
jgi:hypothetical protein